MNYKVEVTEFDDRNQLTATHDGKQVTQAWDHGEPEDNSFHRDYSWVAPALKLAYQLGLEDGKKR